MAQDTTVIRRFQFSTTEALSIEIGHYYMRFYKNGAIINVTGTDDPYILETVYPASAVRDLYLKQINDVTFICHPDYPPFQLLRYADNSWALEEIDWTYPPFLSQNADDTITITPSGTTGSINLVSSTGIFQEEMDGGFFRIGHTRESSDTPIVLTANGTGTAVKIIGDYEVNTYGNWGARLLLQRSDDGTANWTTIRIFESVWDAATSSGSNNFTVSGKADEQAYYRLKVEDYVNSDGTIAKAVLTRQNALVWGVVQITGFTDTSHVSATVIEPLESTDATYWWAEGSWSDYRGYPRCVELHEQRMYFAGTKYQPSTFWGSQSGDFYNFDTGNLADGESFSFQIAGSELNAIQWMVSQTSLIIGTSGEVHRVRGDSTGKNITPTQVDVKMQERIGSEPIKPLVVDGAIIFVARKGKRIMELMYKYEEEKFSARDLTTKSEHLFADGVYEIEYQYDPIPTIWAVAKSGELLSLAYNRDEDVLGWSRQVTDGAFESCASIYGANDANDELWVIVKRTIGYADYRYVERINPAIWEDLEDAYYVDCGLTYSGSAITDVNGLSHLEGMTLCALADGVVYEDLVVSSGSVTLPVSAEKIHIGLQYDSELKPFRLDTDSSIGPSIGRAKRIGGAHLRINEGADFKYEYNGSDIPYSTGGELFSGDAKLDFSTGSSYDPSIVIKQDKPLPLSIQAIVVAYEVTGDV